MFRDQGYDVTHQEAPDLKVSNPWFSFYVEATTVAPSTSGALATHPNPMTPEEVAEFNLNYMPMKFGSPLVSKLEKRDANGLHYWERQGEPNMPFVIAIADFHKEATKEETGSMVYTQSGLYAYLFGARVSVEEVDGKVLLKTVPISEHTYNGKTVPSGFFDLPGAENVSAVIFSNAGTLAKFNRLGIRAGFAPPKYRYFRAGFSFDPDPNALVGTPFYVDVQDPNYVEYWGDEVQVFHNPNAKHPISPEAFPDAANFMYRDGILQTIDRPGRVLGSVTLNFKIQDNNDPEGG